MQTIIIAKEVPDGFECTGKDETETCKWVRLVADQDVIVCGLFGNKPVGYPYGQLIKVPECQKATESSLEKIPVFKVRVARDSLERVEVYTAEDIRKALQVKA